MIYFYLESVGGESHLEPVENRERKLNTVAPYRRRLYAFLIDYLVIIGYGLILVLLSFVLRSFFQSLFLKNSFVAELAGFCFITLPVMLYFIFMEASRKGGTLGKRMQNIRVVKQDGKRIGLGRAAFRSIIKFLPWEISHFSIWNMVRPSDFPDSFITSILITVNILAFLYIFFPLTNKQRKNVYDWIAGTTVVSYKK